MIAKQMWQKYLHLLNLGDGIWAPITLTSELYELNIFLKYFINEKL